MIKTTSVLWYCRWLLSFLAETLLTLLDKLEHLQGRFGLEF
jgi:hypothetical protein